jgi:hypothetical protein
MLVFISGWVLNDMFASLNAEQPDVLGINIGNSMEQPSPSDIIGEDRIHVYNDKVIIDIDNPVWARFTDTNSMDPVFDKGANAIQIVPDSADQINVGDIISFETKYQSGTIIHRVIEQGEDEEGWYVITKGDNNSFKDPGKVRFKDIKKVLVGIIY